MPQRDDQHFIDRSLKATRVTTVTPVQIVTDGLAAELGYLDVSVGEVDADTSATTLVTQNVLRRRLLVFNDSSAAMRIKLGPGADADDYSILLPAQGVLMFDPPMYVGEITAVWESATGSARVTDMRVG